MRVRRCAGFRSEPEQFGGWYVAGMAGETMTDQDPRLAGPTITSEFSDADRWDAIGHWARSRPDGRATRIGWRPDAWRSALDSCPLTKGRISTLEDRCATFGTWRTRFHGQPSAGCWIDRRTVSAAFTHDSVDGFVATMVWGYGPGNRGPARIARIVAKNEHLDGWIDTVVNTARGTDIDPMVLWRQMIEDEPTIKGLGPAFATKVAALAAGDDSRPRPLIADALVADALARTGLPDPRARDGYVRYLIGAERQRDRAEPDRIEAALFDWAKQLAAAAKQQRSG
jgi:hypothetical protein